MCLMLRVLKAPCCHLLMIKNVRRILACLYEGEKCSWYLYVVISHCVIWHIRLYKKKLSKHNWNTVAIRNLAETVQTMRIVQWWFSFTLFYLLYFRILYGKVDIMTAISRFCPPPPPPSWLLPEGGGIFNWVRTKRIRRSDTMNKDRMCKSWDTSLRASSVTAC